VKYNNGDTLHLPTSLLVDQQMELTTSEQLPVPGVAFPDYKNGHFVSWGIVDGTRTGYIYTWSWTKPDLFPVYTTYNAIEEFKQALLTLINDYSLDGLVIDSRFNIGGYINEYPKPLAILFNQNRNDFKALIRNQSHNHFSMGESDMYDFSIKATEYLFDKPIAVLTGPFSVSCGDLMPLQMRKHPMVRTFGLATNGAYSSVWPREIGDSYPEWMVTTTSSNMQCIDWPGEFLTHAWIPPD